MVRILRLLPTALTSLALITACAGQNNSSSSGLNPPATLHERASLHGSWMDAKAKAQRLLYVSDTENNAVYVYGASSNKLVGTLGGFERPLGECVDAKSNVWIVDSAALTEYAHGGTTPIGSISMYDFYAGGYHPYSCAVDPTSGDLAISIIDRYEGGDAGLILICSSNTNCSANEQHAQAFIYFVSYDKNGNLYANGTKRGKPGLWMVMRPHGGSFQKFTISGATISAPGGLVNADGVFSVGAPGTSGNSVIYQVGANGTVTGTTQLSNANGCNQFAIQGNATKQRVTCPNSGGANVTKYNYPAGGSPVVTIKGKFAQPFAAVYSN
jgi:hypothetical protein